MGGTLWCIRDQVILLTPEDDPIKDAALMSTQYPKLNVLIRHGDISSKETFRRSAVHKAEKVCARDAGSLRGCIVCGSMPRANLPPCVGGR
jgi:hypothetical protein